MFSGNIVLTKKAEKDINAATEWYDERSEGLAEEFMAELVAILKKVEKNPTAFSSANNSVRKCFLKRFPYTIYFAPLNRIVVLRVRHFKQNP